MQQSALAMLQPPELGMIAEDERFSPANRVAAIEAMHGRIKTYAGGGPVKIEPSTVLKSMNVRQLTQLKRLPSLSKYEVAEIDAEIASRSAPSAEGPATPSEPTIGPLNDAPDPERMAPTVTPFVNAPPEPPPTIDQSTLNLLNDAPDPERMAPTDAAGWRDPGPHQVIDDLRRRPEVARLRAAGTDQLRAGEDDPGQPPREPRTPLEMLSRPELGGDSPAVQRALRVQQAGRWQGRPEAFTPGPPADEASMVPTPAMSEPGQGLDTLALAQQQNGGAQPLTRFQRMINSVPGRDRWVNGDEWAEDRINAAVDKQPWLASPYEDKDAGQSPGERALSYLSGTVAPALGINLGDRPSSAPSNRPGIPAPGRALAQDAAPAATPLDVLGMSPDTAAAGLERELAPAPAPAAARSAPGARRPAEQRRSAAPAGGARTEAPAPAAPSNDGKALAMLEAGEIPKEPNAGATAASPDDDSVDWGLPLMTAGLATLANADKPFFQALGQGGLAGAAEVNRLKSEKRENRRQDRQDRREDRRAGQADREIELSGRQLDENRRQFDVKEEREAPVREAQAKLYGAQADYYKNRPAGGAGGGGGSVGQRARAYMAANPDMTEEEAYSAALSDTKRGGGTGGSNTILKGMIDAIKDDPMMPVSEKLKMIRELDGATAPATGGASAGSYKVGQTATNPKTGEKVTWDGKAWVKATP